MQGIEKFIKDIKELQEISKQSELVCKVICDVDIIRNVFITRITFCLEDGIERNISFERGL